MTDERKNEIWRQLPSDFKSDVNDLYTDAVKENNTFAIAHRIILEDLFGQHNLTAQAEGKPKEPRFKVGDKVVVASNKSLADSVGDECCVVTEVLPHGYHIDSSDKSWFAKDGDLALCPSDKNSVSSRQNCTNPTENGISDSKIQSESAESVETNTNERLNDKSLPYGKRVVTPFGEGVIVMDIEGCKCVKLDAGGCAGIDKAVLISETENPIDYSQYRLDLAKEIAVAMINSECDWDVSNCAVSYANEIVKRLKETDNAD